MANDHQITTMDTSHVNAEQLASHRLICNIIKSKYNIKYLYVPFSCNVILLLCNFKLIQDMKLCINFKKGESSSSPRRSSRHWNCDRDAGHERLLNDYFSNVLVYPGSVFR